MKNRFYDLAVACDYMGAIGWIDELRINILTAINKGEKSHHEYFIANGDGELQLFYAWLVVMYGDYGINPQNGWIEDLVGCLKFIDGFQDLLKHPPFESEDDYNARF